MGNLTNDGQTYKFEYDAFGRLRKIRDQSNNLVEEFRYNGLNHRIAWLYDADNDVDGSDPWFYFVYDRSWRMVASYRGSDAEAKELFVNHQAGLNGTQTSLPLDAFVLRDRNTAGYWADSVSSFSGERTYHCQNYFGGRGDVVAILTSAGKQMEQVRYSAYGVPFGIPAGDTNADGGVVATPDIAQITAWTSGAYNVRGDFDLDGDVDNDDVSIVSSNFGKSVGWGKLTVGPNDTLTGFVGGFRKGYCGYEHDGTNPKIMHVRHRAYLADLGRWTRRDPLGYVDGGSLYEYCRSTPMSGLDPMGLWYWNGNAPPAHNGPRPSQGAPREPVLATTRNSGAAPACLQLTWTAQADAPIAYITTQGCPDFDRPIAISAATEDYYSKCSSGSLSVGCTPCSLGPARSLEPTVSIVTGSGTSRLCSASAYGQCTRQVTERTGTCGSSPDRPPGPPPPTITPPTGPIDVNY